MATNSPPSPHRNRNIAMFLFLMRSGGRKRGREREREGVREGGSEREGDGGRDREIE